MGKTDYAGIDYSYGKSNIDTKTGIHYGVIQANTVGQYWYEDSEAYYYISCPHCGLGMEFKEKCPYCDMKIDYDSFDFIEPTSFIVKDKDYVAEQTQDDPDIFIFKSPYFTYCQYCSPCAPGAGYITNYTDEDIGIKAYCFGHDWFESGKAPYPVYDVKTGKRVN